MAHRKGDDKGWPMWTVLPGLGRNVSSAKLCSIKKPLLGKALALNEWVYVWPSLRIFITVGIQWQATAITELRVLALCVCVCVCVCVYVCVCVCVCVWVQLIIRDDHQVFRLGCSSARPRLR